MADDRRDAPGVLPLAWRGDRVVQYLGLRCLEVADGFAVAHMAVRDDMVNGVGVTHGGIIFSLADSAFAAAANESGERTVTSGADTLFHRSTRGGDILTATARRTDRRGRRSDYEVMVTDDSNELIATVHVRGFSVEDAG